MVSFTLRGFVYHNKNFFKKIVIRNTCRVKLEILVNENKTMTDGSESKQAGLLDAGSLGGRSVGRGARARRLPRGPPCPLMPTS